MCIVQIDYCYYDFNFKYTINFKTVHIPNSSFYVYKERCRSIQERIISILFIKGYHLALQTFDRREERQRVQIS